MRIDFVITELNVGGAERCLTEVAIAMADSGDQVRVFSIGPLPTGQQAQLVDRLRDHGIEVRSGNADSAWRWYSAARRLGDFFRESPPDLCQTFLFHANVLGSWVARRCGVPIVLGGLRVADGNRLRCLVESRAIGRMDEVVCVSQAVADFAQRNLRCSTNKCTVIANGVDTQRFSGGEVFDLTDLGWPADAPVILFVGRMHPQKGLELLQGQVERIVPAGGIVRLLLVGSGPLEGEIDRWCQQIGTDRVTRLPWQADVAPLMRRCKMLVLPSRYEGMPNVVLEAMAAGKPVVCSRVEGITELLGNDDRQTFDIGDDAQMATLIQTILSDPSLAQSLGESNRETVRRGFSIQGMTDAYRELYQGLHLGKRTER